MTSPGLIRHLFVSSSFVCMLNTVFATGPLPNSFTAVSSNEQAVLRWSMQDQKNTLQFIIEHSVDGSSFYALDTITAKAYEGSTPGYTYIHAQAGFNAINYYRLKQVGAAGE